MKETITQVQLKVHDGGCLLETIASQIQRDTPPDGPIYYTKDGGELFFYDSLEMVPSGTKTMFNCNWKPSYGTRHGCPEYILYPREWEKDKDNREMYIWHREAALKLVGKEEFEKLEASDAEFANLVETAIQKERNRSK
jgi:hypothetical protein